MKLIISGTPGTGKTSVAKELAEKTGFKLIMVNDFAEKNNLIAGFDEKRKCKIVDTDLLKKGIKKLKGDFVIEGHLAHFCHGDFVFVLRAEPKELEKRLKKRKWNGKKIKENVEAEILGIILYEACKENKNVFEIETTKRSAEETTNIILKILKGKNIKKYKPGKIDWMEYLG